MKLNLIFDLSTTQPIGTTKRHGGGIYGEIVFKKLVDLEYEFVCLYNSSLWLNPEIEKICHENRLDMLDISELDDFVNTHSDYTVYCPVDTVLTTKVKALATIHGLRRLEMPNDFFQLKYKNKPKEFLLFFPRVIFSALWKRWQILKVRRLIETPNFHFATVSNHSKYTFLNYFPQLESAQIPVFYSPSTIKNEAVDDYKTEQPYFLLVSGNRWEKNNLRALIALDELFSTHKELDGYSVILAGVNSLHQYKWKFNNPKRFQCLGYVEDKTLRSLYKSAYALIYPSLNEGFGYPPVEAMSFGTPVLSSTFTSITEVCGGASLYFNPFDIDEIKNRILMSLDYEIYKTKKEESLLRYKFIKDKQDQDLIKMCNWIVNQVQHG